MSTKQTLNERAARKASKAATGKAKRGTRTKQAPNAKPAPAPIPAPAAKSTPATRPAKTPKPKQPCCCGCGALVVGFYKQGHDARHKGHLLDIATGQTPKHAPATTAEIKARGYTAERIAERGTCSDETTATEARATIARLAWSAFLDTREAKLQAKADRAKATAQKRAEAKAAKTA